MYQGLTKRRVPRAEERRAAPIGPIQGRFAFVLAASLAGCTGTIMPGGTPADPDNPIVEPPPMVEGPTSCKPEQIGLSPLRRLTRTEYDNSIKDLLGVDLGLANDFNEDELAGSFPGNYFTPITESQ